MAAISSGVPKLATGSVVRKALSASGLPDVNRRPSASRSRQGIPRSLGCSASHTPAPLAPRTLREIHAEVHIAATHVPALALAGRRHDALAALQDNAPYGQSSALLEPTFRRYAAMVGPPGDATTLAAKVS